MSTNRVARHMKVQARKDLIKKSKEIIKGNLGDDKELAKQRRKENDKAKGLFLDWHQRFINTPKDHDGVVDELNALANMMKEAITDETVIDWVIRELIDPAIGKAHAMSVAAHFFVEIWVDCPHQKVTDKGLEACGWGAKAVIDKRAWADKGFHIDCPECQNKVMPRDCALASEVDKEVLKKTEKPKPSISLEKPEGMK